MEMGFTCVHTAGSPPVSLTGSYTHLHRLSGRGMVGEWATPHGGARAHMPPICTYIPRVTQVYTRVESCQVLSHVHTQRHTDTCPSGVTQTTQSPTHWCRSTHLCTRTHTGTGHLPSFPSPDSLKEHVVSLTM